MSADARFGDARERARDELSAIMGDAAAPATIDLRRDDGGDAYENDSANLLLFSAATRAAGVDQTSVDAIAADFADDGQTNGSGQIAFDAIKQATADNPDLLATARANLQNQCGVAAPDDTDDLSPAWMPGAPVAAFITNGPLEADASQSFDVGSSTGSSLTYAWDFDGGEMAIEAQTTHVYTAAGTYTVILTVTDEAHRSDTLPVAIRSSQPSTVTTLRRRLISSGTTSESNTRRSRARRDEALG